jgi:hypothetical protein
MGLHHATHRTMHHRSVNIRLAQCEGKKRFASFSLARKVAHRQHGRCKVKLAAYACKFCGGFHVGTHRSRDPRRPCQEEGMD